jgi:hypothetical protein
VRVRIARSRTVRLALVAAAAIAVVAGATGNASATAGSTENWTFGSFWGGVCTCIADVDADGRSDAVAIGNGPTVVRRSQDNQFRFTRENWTSGPAGGQRATAVVDVTGDGRADLVAVNNNGIYVRPSSGAGFGDPERWSDEFWGDGDSLSAGGDRIIADRGTFFADVNGDGMADAIAVTNGTVVVRRSWGGGFGGDEDWTGGPFWGSWNTAFADVNSDGMADAIAVNDDRIWVRRSNGSWFDGNEPWTDEPFVAIRNVKFTMYGNDFFADVTGDGRADAIGVFANKIQVRRSVGDWFESPQDWTPDPFFGNRETWFTDVTGDGKADSIAVNGNGIFVRRSF